MAVSKELAANFYETMCTIRCFEESVKHDFLAGKIPGFVHLYIMKKHCHRRMRRSAEGRPDREHPSRARPLYRKRGRDVNLMMAEIFGREKGLCHGKGGSMHIADFSIGMMVPTASSEAASTSPPARLCL
jgi:pyruvate dehydrogenase E1 component alpha subunit